MRRPTTKFPNPVIRTAVRNRGYGTRKIYNPVQRPPFHGKFYEVLDQFGDNMVIMTKDDVTYWSCPEFGGFTWAAMKADASPGGYWNKNFRTEKGADVATTWTDAVDFGFEVLTIQAGPIPGSIVVDSFTI